MKVLEGLQGLDSAASFRHLECSSYLREEIKDKNFYSHGK